MCSLHLTHPSAHTHLEQWAATLLRLGSTWGFSALLKGLTSVMDNSCRSRDSNPQPWVTSPTLHPLEPRLPLYLPYISSCPLSSSLSVIAYVTLCVCWTSSLNYIKWIILFTLHRRVTLVCAQHRNRDKYILIILNI